MQPRSVPQARSVPSGQTACPATMPSRRQVSIADDASHRDPPQLRAPSALFRLGHLARHIRPRQAVFPTLNHAVAVPRHPPETPIRTVPRLEPNIRNNTLEHTFPFTLTSRSSQEAAAATASSPIDYQRSAACADGCPKARSPELFHCRSMPSRQPALRSSPRGSPRTAAGACRLAASWSADTETLHPSAACDGNPPPGYRCNASCTHPSADPRHTRRTLPARSLHWPRSRCSRVPFSGIRIDSWLSTNAPIVGSSVKP